MIKNFQPTRLYIKECAGVKYFGKSTKENIEEYTGSGVIWKKRIKKYGKESVKTLWISEWFTDPTEIQKFALDFSEKNNIVESTEWANLIPENGLDGLSSEGAKLVNGSPERRKLMCEQYSGIKNPRYDNSKYKLIHENGIVIEITRYEMREKLGIPAHKIINGKYKSSNGWRLETVSINDVGKSGKNHPKYNHVLYNFIHKSGLNETTTCYELAKKYTLCSVKLNAMVRGLHKIHKGWSIKNSDQPIAYK